MLTRRILIFVFLQILAFPLFSQEKVAGNPKNNAYLFWITPSAKDNIYGVSIGILGSETICNFKNLKNSHGLNLQILGQGFFIPLNRNAFGYNSIFGSDTSWMVANKDSVNYKARHNGVLISTFGTMTDISNGIVISSLSSLGYKMNGVAINVLSSKYLTVNGLSIAINNEAFCVNGIQLGIINKTRKLKGVQIGFWCVNQKRKLP
jgi:hypothetical protein